MSHQLFSVIFDGGVQEGMDPKAVEQRLWYHGLLSAEDIDGVRSGKPAVLVSGVTHDRALQYQATLEVAGARSRILPSQEEPPSAAASPQSVTAELPIGPSSEEVFPDLASPNLGTPELGPPELALPDLGSPDLINLATPDPGYPDEIGSLDLGTPNDLPTARVPETSEARMTCPKCGFEQDESAECGACGIVVSKFLQRQRAPGKAP